MTTSATPTITRLKLPAVRRAVQATQWAIQKEKLLAMLEVLELHANGGRFSAEEIQARVGDRKQPVTKSGGSIAVIPLYGVISQRMSMFAEYSGGTSTERFADEFDAAMANTDVSAIVIDCDSPGGNVQGTPELAKRILDARGKGKKIVAVSNGTMASAAYWICSAADEVVSTPSGEIGSIGVFCVHLDESGLNEQLGLSYTLISAGEFKTEGNPYEPLSAEAESFIQGQIDEMYGMFVGAVAKHRGVKVTAVKADYGKGRCLTATQALAAGMIDRIATLEETLTRLGAKGVGASGRPKSAFATSEATLAEGGRPVVSQLLAAGADTPEPAEVDPVDDPDDDVCPQCGAALNDDGGCTACDYTTPESKKSARAAGAAAVIGSISPGDRPLEAKEHTVNNGPTAAPTGADHQAVVAAERKRAGDVRALGRLHRIPDDQIDAMVNEGLSEEQAGIRILSTIQSRGANAPTIRVGADREAEKPFASLGEQLVSIVHSKRFGRKDARLERVNYDAMQVDRAGALDMMAGSPSGQNESVGSEGGFFIAPEVLPGVIEPIYTQDPFLARVTRIPIGSQTNRTVYNVVDESSRVDGSRWGGIQMFYADEADTVAAKKWKLRQVEQLLKKIMGIGYLTEEQVLDAPASEALLTKAFTTELAFMLSSEAFRGVGGSHLLGFLKGKGGVVQTIEGTQTIANSATFVSQNVAKMLANIPSTLWGDVIFLYNQELLPVLMNATVGGTSIPVFIGAGGLAGRMSDTILGRAAFPSELCEAIGTPGDLIAVAPSQYHMAEKGGAQIATSLHVRFLNDELTLKITYRADGKPVWNTTVVPFKGTSARGFFSTLNTRV